MKWRRNGLDDRRQRERRRFGRVAQTGEDWCLQKRRRNWRRFGSYRTGRKIVWRSRRKSNPYRLSSAVRIRTRGSVSRRELDAHSFLLRFVRFGHGNLDSESANWDFYLSVITRSDVNANHRLRAGNVAAFTPANRSLARPESRAR